MDRIYVFILRNDVWIVILASLGLIWYISEYIRSRRLLKRAVFGLERERGTELRNRATLFILGLTAVIALILYVNITVAPNLPATLLRPPTPTPNLQRPPLTSPTPLATTPPTPTPPIAPTITLSGQPAIPPPPNPITNSGDITVGAATREPGADTAVSITTPLIPPTPFIGCNLQLTLSEPRNGAVVIGGIEFFGTVNTPDFGGYTLEANGPQTNGQWASLLGRTFTEPVLDSLLGNVNLSQWQPGPYLIRLTAVDANQNPAYQCVIQVTLEDE